MVLLLVKLWTPAGWAFIVHIRWCSTTFYVTMSLRIPLATCWCCSNCWCPGSGVWDGWRGYVVPGTRVDISPHWSYADEWTFQPVTLSLHASRWSVIIVEKSIFLVLYTMSHFLLLFLGETSLDKWVYMLNRCEYILTYVYIYMLGWNFFSFALDCNVHIYLIRFPPAPLNLWPYDDL